MQSDIKSFLESYFTNQLYEVNEIKGDASLRKYYRIFSDNRSYILMDSSKELFSIQPFIEITNLLLLQNQNPPRILKEDINSGLLLLEDLGQNIINKIINDENEEELYKKIIDCLIDIHKFDSEFCISNCNFKFPDNFKEFLITELEIFTDYYLRMVKKIPFVDTKKNEFLALFRTKLNELPTLPNVLILADFHLDNLILLNSGKIGLLDYQDALIGSPIYDLVSLLQDARRFVDFDLAEKIIEYYCQKSGLNPVEVKKHYHLLGVQRNVRIIGIFARKVIKENNSDYLEKYLPILNKYIQHSIKKTDIPIKFITELLSYQL